MLRTGLDSSEEMGEGGEGGRKGRAGGVVVRCKVGFLGYITPRLRGRRALPSAGPWTSASANAAGSMCGKVHSVLSRRGSGWPFAPPTPRTYAARPVQIAAGCCWAGSGVGVADGGDVVSAGGSCVGRGSSWAVELECVSRSPLISSGVLSQGWV